MSRFFMISLDPAQLYDYSALSVMECIPEKEGKIYRLVDVKRKQKLPYPGIVQWAEHVFKNPKFRSEGLSTPIFLIDVGGVGRALYDMIRADGVECIAIQYTGGGEIPSFANGAYHIGKSALVGKFLAAWDDGRVQVPANASFRDLLINELKAFRGHMSSQGRARFEAEQGEHDDMIMSIAQAVWWAETRPQEITKLTFTGGKRVPPWKQSGSIRGGQNWLSDAARHHGGSATIVGGVNHR
jgi:hypothetical protein